MVVSWQGFCVAVSIYVQLCPQRNKDGHIGDINDSDKGKDKGNDNDKDNARDDDKEKVIAVNTTNDRRRYEMQI